MSDDEFEPIDTTTDDDGADANDAGVIVPEGDPVEERQIGRIRRVDDTARKLFADAAKALKPQLAALEDDDLEPAIDNDNAPPAAAAGSAPAPASPSGQSTSSPAAAAPASPAATAIDSRAQAQLELREKAMADREAALNAREQALATRENARERYTENPGATIRDLIKEWSGAGSDDELKDEIADLITDLSAAALGIPVPNEHRTRLESRKAVRTVKHYQAKNAARDAELAKKAQEQAEEQAQTARENAAIAGVESLLTPTKDKFPHLMAEDNPAAIVWDVIKTKHARDGLEPNWEEAAKLADDHFKKKNDAYIAKRRHLLAPAPAQAAAVAASAPQGNDPQSRRSSTLTNKTTVAPVAPKTPAPQNEEPAPFDRATHRRQSFALLKSALKETPAE